MNRTASFSDVYRAKRRTELSRGCVNGTRFKSEFAAWKAIDRGAVGTGVRKCKLCPFWHLTVPAPTAESFSPVVTTLLVARDPWCILCGSPRNLHKHHRRIRGDGGDPRPHTDCACVGVRLCSTCHAWIHDTEEGRVLAKAEGLIIPRVTAFPGSLSVLVHSEGDGGGITMYPSCDGWWLPDPPGGAS